MLNLADICLEKKLHLTTYATGCIFHYDKDFPEGSGKGFKEEDTPNFTGSYYSYTKVMMASLSTAPSSEPPRQNCCMLHATSLSQCTLSEPSAPCWHDEDVPSHCMHACEVICCTRNQVQGAPGIACSIKQQWTPGHCASLDQDHAIAHVLAACLPCHCMHVTETLPVFRACSYCMSQMLAACLPCQYAILQDCRSAID